MKACKLLLASSKYCAQFDWIQHLLPFTYVAVLGGLVGFFPVCQVVLIAGNTEQAALGLDSLVGISPVCAGCCYSRG